MFFKRNLEQVLKKYAQKFRVVALVGPRQAGKSVLVQNAFPNHTYFSLEDPDTIDMVRFDPRNFLEKDYSSQGIILDEFQNEPKLLSYLQGIVDKNPRPGYYILTGSHNFLMNQAITQSLAGRVGILTLLPLSLQELKQNNLNLENLDKTIYTGCYPEIYAQNFEPEEYYPSYVKTFVERDVRQLINVVNLLDFQKFMRLCAGRIGQVLNLTSLSDDCGASVATIKSWLSILESSYIIFLLQPHFKNFSKRLIKSPKLYFYDTGLASWLLKINSVDQLSEHYLKGGLTESLIISELFKKNYNLGKEPNLYFWRDHRGLEIDCIIDNGQKLTPIEIKSGKTINTSFWDNLHKWSDLANSKYSDGYIVYAGDESETRSLGNITSWKDVDKIE